MQRITPAPSLQQMLSNPISNRRKPGSQLQPQHQQRSSGETKEKFMRLRGKIRILHNSYLQCGEIADRDADVVFVCSDGKVRAHKVILATVSIFFNDLFQGQKAGSMSHVIVPDIALATMKVILLLAYRDNLNLTKKQMKDVALHLHMFGMDLKNFVFDESNLAEQSGVATTPQPQQHQAKRPPPPMTVRPNPPPLQQIAPIHRQIGSITISGTGRFTQPGPVSRASGGTSSGEEGDYKMFQGYDPLAPPPLKQVRLTSSPQGLAQIQIKKQKPAVSSQFRKIAPKPADPLPIIQPAMNMIIGSQEIQFDDNDDDDTGQVLDPEQGRLMVQEWMQNVSGLENEETQNGGSLSASTPRNQCLICNNIFNDPEKWRWHESHHVGLGIFKCAYCDELFSTSRKVYQHEMMEHGVSGSANASLDDPPPIPSDFQIVQGRKRRFHDEGHQEKQLSREQLPRMTLVRTSNGTHYRRIPTPLSKKLLSKYAKKPIMSTVGEARTVSPSIGIGIAEGEELLEDRKIKQLHWIYVCQHVISGNKCQFVSDSLGKAQNHYNKCFTDKSEIFEKSVMKYRQGFFGKFACPICPRRYTTNHGFTIHSGHLHNDFRRKFQHINQNDTLACICCRKRFVMPREFHAHLGDDGECNAQPVYSASDKSTKWIGNEIPGERKSAAPVKKDTISGSPSSKAKPSPQSAISHGRTGMESQARSTRLANRRQQTAEAELPEDSYASVDCPIPECGSHETKIVEHLNRVHKEMELNVSRISNTALRCQKCSISFGIPDLISHDTFACIKSKQFQHIKEKKLQHKDGKGEERASNTPTNNGIILIPDGIGNSPVDRMENFDQLTSTDLIRKAMRCGVCGRINTKLGTISECLRSHGIFRCALCFNSYSDKPTYSSHLREVHTLDNGKLKCPLCEKAQFVNAGQVAGHLYNCHWEVVFRKVFSEDAQTSLQPKEIKIEPKVESKDEENSVQDGESDPKDEDAAMENLTGGDEGTDEVAHESNEAEKLIEASNETEAEMPVEVEKAGAELLLSQTEPIETEVKQMDEGKNVEKSISEN